MPHNKGTPRPRSEQWQILWGMRWESGTKKRWLKGIIVESPGVSWWTREAFNNREMGEGRYNLFLEWNILGSLGLEHPETMPHWVGGNQCSTKAPQVPCPLRLTILISGAGLPHDFSLRAIGYFLYLRAGLLIQDLEGTKVRQWGVWTSDELLG